MLWKPSCDLASSSLPLPRHTVFPPQVSKLLPEHANPLHANLFPALTSLCLLFIHSAWNYLSPDICRAAYLFHSHVSSPTKIAAPYPPLLPMALLYFFFIALDILVYICFIIVVIVHCLSASWEPACLYISFTAVSPVLGTEPSPWLLFIKRLLNERMRETRGGT